MGNDKYYKQHYSFHMKTVKCTYATCGNFSYPKSCESVYICYTFPSLLIISLDFVEGASFVNQNFSVNL